MRWRILPRLHILMRALFALSVLLLFIFLSTPVAYADNCGSLTDCFPTTEAATAVTVAVAVLIAVGLLALPQLLENPPPPPTDALPPPSPVSPGEAVAALPPVLPGQVPLPPFPPLPPPPPEEEEAEGDEDGSRRKKESTAPLEGARQEADTQPFRAGAEGSHEPHLQEGHLGQQHAGSEVHHTHEHHSGAEEHHHHDDPEKHPTHPLRHEDPPKHDGPHKHEEPPKPGEPPKHHEPPKHEEPPRYHEPPTVPLGEPRLASGLQMPHSGHEVGAVHGGAEGQEQHVEMGAQGSYATPEGRMHHAESAMQEPLVPAVGPEAAAETLLGLHHVTAIASDPQRNIDFYTGLLGLRLVKVTVNIDVPNTYQFYYGDTWGQPGSILSFICVPNTAPGTRGTGQVTSVAFAVAEGALQFWAQYLTERGITVGGPSQRFDTQVISFFDPDGLQIDLVAQRETQERGAWNNGRIPPAYTLRGLYGVSMAVARHEQTDRLLNEVLDFRLVGEAGNRRRYQLQGSKAGAVLDLVHLPMVPGGSVGVGIVQNVGWRTPAEAQQLAWYYKLDNLGIRVNPSTDRLYFRSLYFYEPGGVLFDIATDTPGFLVDERAEELGTHLVLPSWLEAQRSQLLQTLPPLRLPGHP